jgi:hypothetical protein
VVARAQEPPQRQVVHLLLACVRACDDGGRKFQLVSERSQR